MVPAFVCRMGSVAATATTAATVIVTTVLIIDQQENDDDELKPAKCICAIFSKPKKDV